MEFLDLGAFKTRLLGLLHTFTTEVDYLTLVQADREGAFPPLVIDAGWHQQSAVISCRNGHSIVLSALLVGC